MTRDRGVRAIILYKTIKGIAQLALAVVLAIAIIAGVARAPLDALARVLWHHATHAWALWLARLLGRISRPAFLDMTCIALAADGVVSSIEGWALRKGAWWGPWIVVVASGTLIPFEIAELARHFHPTRILVVVVNVAIVAYLARRALGERRAAFGNAP